MNQRPIATTSQLPPGRTASGSSTDSYGLVTPTQHRHSAWETRQQRRVKRSGGGGSSTKGMVLLPDWDYWLSGSTKKTNPYAHPRPAGSQRMLVLLVVGIVVFLLGGATVLLTTTASTASSQPPSPSAPNLSHPNSERSLEQEQKDAAKERHQQRLQAHQEQGAFVRNPQQEILNQQHATHHKPTNQNNNNNNNNNDDVLSELTLPPLKFPPFPPVTMPSMNYCDLSRDGMDQQLAQHLSTEHELAPPVVLVLGMEDTSSQLFLKLLQRLLVPTTAANTNNNDHPDNIDNMMMMDVDLDHDDVELLQAPDLPTVQFFWNELPDTDRGNWIMHAYCRQQQLHAKQNQQQHTNGNHPNNHLIHIQWMTYGDTVSTGNIKAKDTLTHVAAFQKLHPHHNLKVIRYKRNPLDLLIRQMVLDELVHPDRPHAHQFRGARGKPLVQHPLLHQQPHARPAFDRGPTITMNKHSILSKLTKLTKQQEAVETLLQDLTVDHVVVDHENLFPFSAWKDFVNITHSLSAQLLQQSTSPHTDPTPLETEWKRVLEYLHQGSHLQKLRRTEVVPQLANALQQNAARPQHRHPSHQASLSHAGQMALFAQPEMVDNYKAVEQELLGTRHEHVLRNVKHEHDFYGCACNDAQRPVKKFHIDPDKIHPQEKFPILKPDRR